MPWTRALGLASIAACMASSAGLADAASPGTAGLAAAFRTCSGLDQHRLASALMRSVWSPEEREQLPARHAGSVRSWQLEVFGPPDDASRVGVASVELRQPVMVAGQRAKRLSAATCVDGCGVSVWYLEFPSAAEAPLQAWIASLPPAAAPAPPAGDDEERDEAVRVSLSRIPSGVLLSCDLSR